MPHDGLDRRRFIQVAARVGAAAAFGAAGYGLLRPASDVDVNVVPIRYPGAKVLPDSPAPYGLPLIPLRLDDDGALVGVADAAEGQLSWYKYCGHERAPGTDPSFATDDRLRYFAAGSAGSGGPAPWYGDRLDEVVAADHFPDTPPDERFAPFPGVGAPFAWRSEGLTPGDAIQGIVVRAPVQMLRFEGAAAVDRDALLAWMPPDPADPSFRFVACCSFCTHLCCVPGFHASQVALDKNAGETIFCACHFSKYDPFTFTYYDRTIYVFPDKVTPSDVG